MISRRDVLVGVGAGLGVAAFSVAALARRTAGSGPPYEFGEMGSPVDSLTGANLECTPGTLTARQTEGPFYTPKTAKRRDIRDAGVSTGVLVRAGRVVDAQCRLVDDFHGGGRIASDPLRSDLPPTTLTRGSLFRHPK